MSLVEYAKSELERLTKDKDGMQEVINRDILEIVEKFSGQGHSGFSASYALSILERLLRFKPIAPLTGEDDEWAEIHEKNGLTTYQNRRCCSVFKDVYDDGRVEFTDVDRVICKDFKNEDAPSWSNSFITKNIVDEMFPITFPYSPSFTPYKVYVYEFLTDPKNGDYDTVGIIWLVTPKGERIHVDRYFKEEKREWIEIDQDEYDDRLFTSFDNQ